MKTKCVSIIIPTYGRALRLVETVRSVLSQDYEDIEVIIVDDNGEGQDDQIATQKELHTIGDPRIKYIILDKNHGGSYARNRGVDSSNGEYICFLDDDDLFEPQKTRKQVEYLNAHPTMVGCFCDHIRRFEETGKEIRYHSPYSGRMLKELLLFKVDACSGSTLMVRRSAFFSLQGFQEDLRRNQDYEFITRLNFIGEIGLIPEPLVIINTHSGSNRLPNFRGIEYNRTLYLKTIKHIIQAQTKEIQYEVHYTNTLFLFISAIKTRSLSGMAKYCLPAITNWRFFYYLYNKLKK